MATEDKGIEHSEAEKWILQSPMVPAEPMDRAIPQPPMAEFPLPSCVDKEGAGSICLSNKQSKTSLLFKIAFAHEYNSVTRAFKTANFKRTTSANWNVLWTKHLTPEAYSHMLPLQKTNHFPGSWVLGRKDKLARLMESRRRLFGSKHFAFIPRSYVLPADALSLAREMDDGASGANFITKPCASSCGKGIKVGRKAASKAIKSSKASVVQRYIADPLLIDGCKWDLRLYVVVVSYDPLVAYWFEDGLVRFCTVKYKPNSKSRYSHLSNYSVQKKRTSYVKNKDATDDSSGSKWSFKALCRYLSEQGKNVPKMTEKIRDLMRKTLIAADYEISPLVSTHFRYRHIGGCPCFEVLGFDVLIDRKMNPWLMEVNISPSLSSSAPLDKRLKTTLMSDTFQLIGVPLIDMKKHRLQYNELKMNRLLGLEKSNFGEYRHASTLSAESLSWTGLRSEDLCILRTFSQTYSRARKRNFELLFPVSPERSSYYAQFFENPRYSDVLLARWLSGGCIEGFGPIPRSPRKRKGLLHVLLNKSAKKKDASATRPTRGKTQKGRGKPRLEPPSRFAPTPPSDAVSPLSTTDTDWARSEPCTAKDVLEARLDSPSGSPEPATADRRAEGLPLVDEPGVMLADGGVAVRLARTATPGSALKWMERRNSRPLSSRSGGQSLLGPFAPERRSRTPSSMAAPVLQGDTMTISGKHVWNHFGKPEPRRTHSLDLQSGEPPQGLRAVSSPRKRKATFRIPSAAPLIPKPPRPGPAPPQAAPEPAVQRGSEPSLNEKLFLWNWRRSKGRG